MYLVDFVIFNDFRVPKPFAAVSQLPAALWLPQKKRRPWNLEACILWILSNFSDCCSFLMILRCLDLYFLCLDLSLRSAKGVNNCQVSPSANMRTAKGLLLTESVLRPWDLSHPIRAELSSNLLH